MRLNENGKTLLYNTCKNNLRQKKLSKGGVLITKSLRNNKKDNVIIKSFQIIVKD